MDTINNMNEYTGRRRIGLSAIAEIDSTLLTNVESRSRILEVAKIEREDRIYDRNGKTSYTGRHRRIAKYLDLQGQGYASKRHYQRHQSRWSMEGPACGLPSLPRLTKSEAARPEIKKAGDYRRIITSVAATLPLTGFQAFGGKAQYALPTFSIADTFNMCQWLYKNTWVR